MSLQNNDDLADTYKIWHFIWNCCKRVNVPLKFSPQNQKISLFLIKQPAGTLPTGDYIIALLSNELNKTTSI